MVRRPILLAALLAVTLAPAALPAQDLPGVGYVAGTIDPNGASSSSTSPETQPVATSLSQNEAPTDTMGTIDPNGLAARPLPEPSLRTLVTWLRVFLPL